MDNPQSPDAEKKRIVAAYEKRISSNVHDRYSLFYPGELYMLQRREEELLRMLKYAGVRDLTDRAILEVGCGRGSRLADWIRWGARPRHLSGIDLMPAFIAEAQDYLPNADFQVGSAEDLPYPDQSFDIVVQQTVFSSIKDQDLRKAIVCEIMRVLKPDGLLIWFDLRYPNPGNKDLKPIGRSELYGLFPDCRINLKSTTLLPPLSRRLAGFSMLLCRLLESIPPLRSHYLALIRKA
ncbi:MAG: class I SAM-dependent methyltransferase [Gammaproteobacteria bacterium]|nr:class I SAM-dependent methyltransferase [Gammaproteobacteria bacterium]MDH3535695.1 class I SAM-dependent methyltransferase [Gammaproteobacteria bacterium]